VEDFRKQLQCDIEKVSERLPERIDTQRKVEFHVERLNQKVAHFSEVIVKSGEELKLIIDRMTKSLLNELIQVKQDRLKELEEVKEKLDYDVMLLNGFKEYAETVKVKGTPCDLSRSVNDLHVRAETLSSLHFNQFDKVLTSFSVNFESLVNKTEQDFMTGQNLVGQINVSNHASASSSTLRNGLISSSAVTARRLTRLDTDGRYVIGLGQLKDKVYVICGCSNSVKVYDSSQSYKRLDVIKISKLKDPADLSVSQSCNCLYVTDSGNSCVWRVSKLDKNGLNGKADKWLTGIGWPYKTSVTNDGRVLIISWSPALINVYSAEAAKLWSVTLSAEIVEPQNAIESSTGTYLVTHGWTNSQVHQVVELNKEGQILKQFGDVKGSGPCQLDLPSHLTLDQCGRVIVADYNNSRVVIIESTLSAAMSKVLMSWSLDSIKEPRRVCFVASSLSSSSSSPEFDVGSSPSHQVSKGKARVKSSIIPSSPGVSGENMEGRESGRLLIGLNGAVDVFSVYDY